MFKTLILCLFSFACLSQKLSPKEIAKTLCTPEFHGRGYVANGDSLAAVFLAEQCKAYGLKPVNGSNYFQEYQFSVNSFPGKVFLKIGNNVLKTGRDFILEASSGSYTGKLNLTKVDRSVLSSKEQFANLVKEVRNSRNSGLLFQLEGIPKDSLKIISKLMDELEEFCPIVELTIEKFTWSVSQRASKFPHLLIRDSLYSGEDEIELTIENQIVKDHHAYNVLAYAPSKKRQQKKYLFISAHYDHLGRMGAETYFPGANDNASGTAILFGLAEKFVNNPSKYNLVVCFFSGEEAGLLGSKYYTENPLIPLEKIKFLLNLDIMGSGEEGVTMVNGTIYKEQFDRLVKINNKRNFIAKIHTRGKAANSDHYFFSEKGVPSMFMYTMGPNKNYHDINDTFENLSFAEFEDLQSLIDLFLRSF